MLVCKFQVVLPEGSKDISASVPFPVKQWQEVLLHLYIPPSHGFSIPLIRFYSPSMQLMQTKLSHLDIVGRPVVVLEKNNVVPEHNQHFQVLLLHLFVKLKVNL